MRPRVDEANGPDGEFRYELPDGTFVDESPLEDAGEPPPGWWERFNIAPEDRPPKWRKTSAG